MGTFAETAIVDYRLNAIQRFSVCWKRISLLSPSGRQDIGAWWSKSTVNREKENATRGGAA
jgi:hypothetical protein